MEQVISLTFISDQLSPIDSERWWNSEDFFSNSVWSLSVFAMLFMLPNSLGMGMDMMIRVFWKYLYISVIVFIDDTIIYSWSEN